MVGALTLEWPAETRLLESRLEHIELMASMLGPLMADKQAAGRSWWIRAGDSLAAGARAVFGPRHYGYKAALAAMALALAFVSLYPGNYRVTADALLENTVKQVVVAPVDGFVESAAVRAGDVISAGDAVYHLDDRDLTLEKLRWNSEVLGFERQMRDAVAGREAAKVRVLEAQLEQARSQLALIEAQIARLSPVAPFDGVVISGDLSQSIGAPVSRGEVLFEITPLDAFRVILMVDERDIDAVAVGQAGRVVLRSGSEAGMAFVVDRVSPLAETWEGINAFRVEGLLDATPDYLRPGMAGIGKVEVGRRSLLWIWTHRFTHWLRLALWEWF
jgi:multidrug resistance efflux pump